MHIETTQQSRRTRRLAASVVGLSLLTVTAAGCGGSDENSSTTAATTAAAETTAGDTMVETTAGDAMVETTAGDAMVETTAGGDEAVTEGGSSEGMTADGTAKMEISPDWTDVSATAGVAAWQVGDVVDGFGPNVNLIGQPAPGGDLQQYIDLTDQQLAAAGLTVVDSGKTTGKNGQELGYFEYTGDLGQGSLHFLVYVNLANDTAAAATFTAGDPAFGEMVDEIRPYLETVEVVQ